MPVSAASTARLRAGLDGMLAASPVSTSLVIARKKSSASAVRSRGSASCRLRHAASRSPGWSSRTFTRPACAAASVLSQIPQRHRQACSAQLSTLLLYRADPTRFASIARCMSLGRGWDYDFNVETLNRFHDKLVRATLQFRFLQESSQILR